ncbi:MAG: hypothetical protein AUH68_02560 [Gemmatimonadetes bacterium 13_1_40CM_4_69_5]|nr:MAG: hypothetical protein AUH68_02560 [Gemmatimonadetes bacterium 13_1_40CM_4_69_5]OLC98199.1 MAG: hypothetical protein AUJ00_00100 [Gemmatimonadetes bacterium 13_1_40CM_3_70_6]
MTRALVTCLTLAAAVSLGAQTPTPTRPATAPPPVKIAFVSSRAIMQQTPGYAAADSALNRDIQAGRDEIARLQQQMDSAVRAFDQQSIALSPAAKTAKQRELQVLQDRYTQRGTELNDRIQQRQQELFGPLNARIRAVIDGIRAEGNYAMIFDADAQGGGLISADPSLDITAKVLQRLQQAQ